MYIYIGFLTYDGLGNHEVLDCVPPFLLLKAPDSFGPAIQTIVIHAHLENRRIPGSISPERRKYFQERMAKLPLLIFQPRNRRLEISYLSRLGMAEDLAREADQPLTVSLFRRACHEIVAALSLIRQRVGPGAGFDFEPFNSCLQRCLQHLPKTLSEMRKAVTAGRIRQHRRDVAEHHATMKRWLKDPKKYKIFKALDFHVYCRHEPPVRLMRAFNRRVNQIVDSFSMRIPEKTKTQFFHKLNVFACDESDVDRDFRHSEGIAHAHILVPDIASIYRRSQTEAVRRVKDILRRGLEYTGKNDALFARQMPLWRRLLATTDQEFDFDLRLSSVHKSRRWRCEAVMRIAPGHYHYDVVVKDARTSREVERHRIKTTECSFPFYSGLGFSQLRWRDQDILVLNRKGDVVRRFKTALPV